MVSGLGGSLSFRPCSWHSALHAAATFCQTADVDVLLGTPFGYSRSKMMPNISCSEVWRLGLLRTACPRRRLDDPMLSDWEAVAIVGVPANLSRSTART